MVQEGGHDQATQATQQAEEEEAQPLVSTADACTLTDPSCHESSAIQGSNGPVHRSTLPEEEDTSLQLRVQRNSNPLGAASGQHQHMAMEVASLQAQIKQVGLNPRRKCECPI